MAPQLAWIGLGNMGRVSAAGRQSNQMKISTPCASAYSYWGGHASENYHILFIKELAFQDCIKDSMCLGSKSSVRAIIAHTTSKVNTTTMTR